MHDDTEDTRVEDENSNPKRSKERAPLGLVVAIGLVLIVTIGIVAYLQFERAETLAAQLKSGEAGQQPKPQPVLKPEERAAIFKAQASIDADVPAQTTVAVDAGAVEAPKPLAKKTEARPVVRPEPEVPVILPEFDGTAGYAVQVHTLWKKWQLWYEKQETAKGLAKCSRDKQDLELFIRQAKGKSKMTALVEGYPLMDEAKAKLVAICLDNAIHVPGQENHFEVVKASDYLDGYAGVVIPEKETPPP